ncbi:hypothetical protein NUH88_00960 [Nisaea acidiphila]|uniref:Uncharacterized protein n=1 Tax=Nisaea acidiphila TaxID=1862145 RepID=A0A9J7ASW8_9PROT|nr:hypothetical protein [Nisaea acidiphila]UUX50270.1 hypothetical protein NUH88_00960 [Nisaea acidiphila]
MKSKSRRRGSIGATVMFLFLGAGAASAGEADVEKVRVERASNGTYTFHVTVRHADTGWDHYANAWVVKTPDGTLLGERVLYHPHVDEQPFTRSLSGVAVPDGTRKVIVSARDSQHGEGGRSIEVDLP